MSISGINLRKELREISKIGIVGKINMRKWEKGIRWLNFKDLANKREVKWSKRL